MPITTDNPYLIHEAERAIWKRLHDAAFIIKSEQQLIAGAMSRLAELKETLGFH